MIEQLKGFDRPKILASEEKATNPMQGAWVTCPKYGKTTVTVAATAAQSYQCVFYFQRFLGRVDGIGNSYTMLCIALVAGANPTLFLRCTDMLCMLVLARTSDQISKI